MSLQIWRNYLQGGDQEQHRFLRYIQNKQTVKICSFLTFLEIFSTEIWIKEKLHNTSRPCYGETKSFTKKHFLKSFYKDDLR